MKTCLVKDRAQRGSVALMRRKNRTKVKMKELQHNRAKLNKLKGD